MDDRWTIRSKRLSNLCFILAGVMLGFLLALAFSAEAAAQAVSPNPLHAGAEVWHLIAAFFVWLLPILTVASKLKGWHRDSQKTATDIAVWRNSMETRVTTMETRFVGHEGECSREHREILDLIATNSLKAEADRRALHERINAIEAGQARIEGMLDMLIQRGDG